ncbi:hypothetical protein SAMN05192561_1381 [Halopenitus malekzadehii]|uniref:Uncharacterized protein n=1 Tax=Halopenitus malekzadehii TaxID=1267564 RepID=A0A1H6KBI6_9EURY|nr:hypothetical protein [Halopenitus malekzadehii]SEH68830.1 hypothetical protein SAMN05192561_1381 [Halopenitus malekzadehii]
MPSDEDWTWKFTPHAADQFDGLDHHVQDRIVSKLDDIVNYPCLVAAFVGSLRQGLPVSMTRFADTE